jgi:hypothetical protein
MWKKLSEEKPKAMYPAPYLVFGIVNAGTEHESKTKFHSFWHEGYGFADRDGEDLTENHKGITHWFDHLQLSNPE